MKAKKTKKAKKANKTKKLAWRIRFVRMGRWYHDDVIAYANSITAAIELAQKKYPRRKISEVSVDDYALETLL